MWARERILQVLSDGVRCSTMLAREWILGSRFQGDPFPPVVSWEEEFAAGYLFAFECRLYETSKPEGGLRFVQGDLEFMLRSALGAHHQGSTEIASNV